MRLLVYPEVLHGGEVHSIDVNKTNEFVLTTGKDGSILIWKVPELTRLNTLDASQIQDQLDQTKYYKKFQYHKSLVKVAQWSYINANVIVSADIEGNVYWNDITASEPKLLYPFSSKEASGVIDLSWSIDERLISWSTEDGKIHLYDIKQETYQELSSLLKVDKLIVQRSVEFDPINKYLITLGDDTTIYLFQYQYDSQTKNYQFKVLHHITRLINQSNINLNYNRISWSPYGEFVSIPTSRKNQTTLITIISKLNNWANSVNIVGHGTLCEVIKYHPQIFEKLPDFVPPESDPALADVQYANVLATAGSDKTLALWNTTKDTPLLVIENLINGSIVDMEWDKTGTSLFLACLNGTIVIVTFDDKELGIPIKPGVIKDFIKPEPVSNKAFNLKADQQTNSRNKNVTVDVLDGKNAISVHSISEQSPEVPEPSEAINQNTKPKSPAEDTKHDYIPEVISAPLLNDEDSTNDLLHATMESRLAKTKPTEPNKANGSNAVIPTPEPELSAASSRIDLSKQKVTIKNGKRKVRPTLVSNGGSNGMSSFLDSTLNGSLSKSNNKTSAKYVMELDKPSFNVSDDYLKSIKRLKTSDDSSVSNKKSKREMEPVKFIGSVVVNPNTAYSRTRLATPKIRYGFLLSSTTINDESSTLDIKNGSGNDAKPSRITYFKKEKQIWSDFIPKFIHLVSEGSSFWAISTSDGQIFTYSHNAGRKVLPPIILGSPLSFLETHGKYLMAITNIGELFVWDLDTKKLHLKSPLSINSLIDNNTKYLDEGISRSDKITLCSLTSLGIPLITLSNGSGYLFNIDLGVWQTITESWWAFGSHYWDSLNGGHQKPELQSTSLFNSDEDNESIINLLENKTNEEIIRGSRTGRGKFFNKISKNMLMKEGFENLENTISISHLENRILCCEMLGEQKFFHGFFITYVKRVCELGLKAKVFEICNSLLGPPDDEHWDPKICGLDKHELLKEVVLTCSDLRDSQRILTHFARKLGLMEK